MYDVVNRPEGPHVLESATGRYPTLSTAFCQARIYARWERLTFKPDLYERAIEQGTGLRILVHRPAGPLDGAA